MSTEQVHLQQVENIGAYALGALPELEARVFERHLMACELCQQELAQLNEAVEALPRSVTPHQPPASVKANLMEQVRADAAARSRPVRARLLPSLPRLGPAFAGAAAACLLGVGLIGGYGLSQVGDDEQGARTLAAEVDAERLGGASASLSVPGDDARGSVLSVEQMPDPGGRRVYQVWVERDGQPVPVSIFDVDREGSGAAAVPEPLDDVSAVMVTREPRGGSEVPSESPVLRIEV